MRRPFPGEIIWRDTRGGFDRLFTGSEFQTISPLINVCCSSLASLGADNITSVLKNSENIAERLHLLAADIFPTFDKDLKRPLVDGQRNAAVK